MRLRRVINDVLFPIAFAGGGIAGHGRNRDVVSLAEHNFYDGRRAEAIEFRDCTSDSLSAAPRRSLSLQRVFVYGDIAQWLRLSR